MSEERIFILHSQQERYAARLAALNLVGASRDVIDAVGRASILSAFLLDGIDGVNALATSNPEDFEEVNAEPMSEEAVIAYFVKLGYEESQIKAMLSNMSEAAATGTVKETTVAHHTPMPTETAHIGDGKNDDAFPPHRGV